MTTIAHTTETAVVDAICGVCLTPISAGDQQVVSQVPHLHGPFCSVGCLQAEAQELAVSLGRVTYTHSAPAPSLAAG